MMMQLNTRQIEGRASVALVDHANTLYCTFLGCAHVNAHLPKGGVAMTFTFQFQKASFGGIKAA